MLGPHACLASAAVWSSLAIITLERKPVANGAQEVCPPFDVTLRAFFPRVGTLKRLWDQPLEPTSMSTSPHGDEPPSPQDEPPSPHDDEPSSPQDIEPSSPR